MGSRNRNQKSQTKSLLLSAAVVLLAVLNVNCGGSSGKSGTDSLGYNPGCPGCAPVTGNIVAAPLAVRQSSDLDIELGMRFFGTGPFANPTTYYGPVVAQGYMRVGYAYWSACPVLPFGNYIIATPAANGSYAPNLSAQAFNLQNFDFDVIHTTGFRAHIHVDYAEFYDAPIRIGADGAQYPHGLYGQMTITPMGGAPTCYMAPVTLFFPL